MMKCIFAFAILVGTVTAQAQVRIGNGGEGIWLSSTEFFLLDLYDEAAHFDPYFGSAVPAFARDAAALWPGLDIDRGLIARKLGDLELVYPGLGRYVLTGAKMLKVRFKMDGEDLYPFYPEDSQLEYRYSRGMGVRFSTIAVRRDSEIIVDGEFWSALDRANKVALLFHEVLFSFARLDCRWSKNWCAQFSPDIRRVVGRLFSRGKWDTELTRELLVEYIRVPDSRLFCASSKWRLNFLARGKAVAGKDFAAKTEMTESDLDGICRAAPTADEIEVIEPVVRVRTRSFVAGMGIPDEPPFSQLQFRGRRHLRTVRKALSLHRDCARELKRQLTAIEQAGPFTEIREAAICGGF